MLFIEKALQLLRERGQMAMSVSSSFLKSASGRALRNLIARQCHVREIVQFTCIGSTPMLRSRLRCFTCRSHCLRNPQDTFCWINPRHSIYL